MPLKSLKNKFKSRSRTRIKSPKRVASPKSPPPKLAPQYSNLPKVNILENVPIEIFCKIWDSIKCIPILYLIQVMQTSKKIRENVIYCTHKLWVDTTKFNPNILKKLTSLKEIYITHGNEIKLKKYIPKGVKIFYEDLVVLTTKNRIPGVDIENGVHLSFHREDVHDLFISDLINASFPDRTEAEWASIYKQLPNKNDYYPIRYAYPTIRMMDDIDGWTAHSIPKVNMTNYDKQIKTLIHDLNKLPIEYKILPPTKYGPKS